MRQSKDGDVQSNPHGELVHFIIINIRLALNNWDERNSKI